MARRRGTSAGATVLLIVFGALVAAVSATYRFVVEHAAVIGASAFICGLSLILYLISRAKAGRESTLESGSSPSSDAGIRSRSPVSPPAAVGRSPPAFSQALRLVRRRGTVSLVGLPPGEFPTPIFDVVLKRITVRGSIVGTRRDLDEAIAFAVEGKVRADIKTAPLSDINTIFANLKAGKVEGRVVLDLSQPAKTRSEIGELAHA